MVTLCVNGLRSHDPYIVKISLSRIQSFIFNEWAAARFEQDDGVVMIVSLLGHQGHLADTGTHSLD
jgi:hypothetical protein